MRCINSVYLVIHEHSISEIIKQTCCGARCVLSFWRHSASVCSFTLTKHPHVPLSRTKIVSATLPRAWTSLTWQADLCSYRCLTACACLCPWFVSANCQRLFSFLNLLLLAHSFKAGGRNPIASLLIMPVNGIRYTCIAVITYCLATFYCKLSVVIQNFVCLLLHFYSQWHGSTLSCS